MGGGKVENGDGVIKDRSEVADTTTVTTCTGATGCEIGKLHARMTNNIEITNNDREE